MHTVSLLFHDVYAADPRESGFASPAADRYKLSLRAFRRAAQPVWRSARADAPVAGCGRDSGGLPFELASGMPSRVRSLKASGYRVPYMWSPVDDGGVSYYTWSRIGSRRAGGGGTVSSSTDAIGTRGFLSRLADSRARHARTCDWQPFGLAPGPFQCLRTRSHARGVGAQPHGARGPRSATR